MTSYSRLNGVEKNTFSQSPHGKCVLKLQANLTIHITQKFHCEISRPGYIPCNSWENNQLQQGNIRPPQFPAISQTFPICSWELSQLCFPCNCWYTSRVHLAKTWDLSQLFNMEEKSFYAKNGLLELCLYIQCCGQGACM